MPAPRERPRYQQIADDLRRRVNAGIIPAGSLLPAEPAMIAEYGVSRGTIRQALDLLRSEGLILTEHGRGSYARPVRKMVHTSHGYLDTSAPVTWRAQLASQGMTGTQSIDAAGLTDAPPEIAAVLGPRVVVRERTMYADGQAVQLAVSYYPAELAEGTELAGGAPLRGGTVAALSRLAATPDRAREEVSARMPSVEERNRLGVPAGIPVIIHRRTTTTGTRPIEVTITVMAADRCVLDYDMPISR